MDEGNFFPLASKMYTIIKKGGVVGRGVYVGSKSRRHLVLMRLDGEVIRYGFNLPPYPSWFDPKHNKYRLEGENLTLPSRATLYKKFRGREKELADEILKRQGL